MQQMTRILAAAASRVAAESSAASWQPLTLAIVAGAMLAVAAMVAVAVRRRAGKSATGEMLLPRFEARPESTQRCNGDSAAGTPALQAHCAGFTETPAALPQSSAYASAFGQRTDGESSCCALLLSHSALHQQALQQGARQNQARELPLGRSSGSSESRSRAVSPERRRPPLPRDPFAHISHKRLSAAMRAAGSPTRMDRL